jgi:hypothetical protein
MRIPSTASNCYLFPDLLLPFLSLCLLPLLYLPFTISPSLCCLFSFYLPPFMYQSATFCLSQCCLFFHLLSLFSTSSSNSFSVHLAFLQCFSVFILPFHVRLMRLCNFFSFKLSLLPCPPMKIRPLLNTSTILHNASTHCP